MKRLSRETRRNIAFGLLSTLWIIGAVVSFVCRYPDALWYGGWFLIIGIGSTIAAAAITSD